MGQFHASAWRVVRGTQRSKLILRRGLRTATMTKKSNWEDSGAAFIATSRVSRAAITERISACSSEARWIHRYPLSSVSPQPSTLRRLN